MRYDYEGLLKTEPNRRTLFDRKHKKTRRNLLQILLSTQAMDTVF